MATTWWVTTTGSDTTGSGTSGAPYATIAKALTVAASGDTIAVQSGTYTVTATMTVTQAILMIQGFATAPGDNGAAPLIQTATSSVPLFATQSLNGRQVFDNLSLKNTAATRASGIWQNPNHGTGQYWLITNCVLDGFTIGIDSSNLVPYDVAYIAVIGCEIKNCTTAGVTTSNASNTLMTKIQGCYFHNNVVHINGLAGTPISISRCIFASATTDAVTLNCPNVVVENCSFYGNAGKGLLLPTGILFGSVSNSIFYGNGYGIFVNTTGNAISASAAMGRNNAFGNNTSGNLNWAAAPGDVTLTANPFTNTSAGDYSLNSTAGGGAACGQAGFPGAFPGGTSTGHPDIGAVQSGSGSSGGGGASNYAFVG